MIIIIIIIQLEKLQSIKPYGLPLLFLLLNLTNISGCPSLVPWFLRLIHKQRVNKTKN